MSKQSYSNSGSYTSSHYTVIFPYNAAYKGFDTSKYNPVLADNELGYVEVDRFISKINLILWKDSRNSDQDSFKKFLIFYALTFMVTLGVIAILEQSPAKVKMDTVIPFLFYIYITIALLLVFWGIKSSYQAKKTFLAAVARVQSEILYENSKLTGRKVRWAMPSRDAKWIELRKENQKLSIIQGSSGKVSEKNSGSRKSSDIGGSRKNSDSVNIQVRQEYRPPSSYYHNYAKGGDVVVKSTKSTPKNFDIV